MCGSRPASRKRFSIWWTLRHWRLPISGIAATSRSEGGLGRPASGESRGRTTTYGIAHQLDGLERPFADREHHEREVELAALDQLEEAAVVGRLGELHGDVRPGVGELAQEAREHPRADALVGADVERPGRALRERGHVGLGRLQAGDDARGVAEEELAGLGQGDPARSAGPLDELLPDDALERLDLLADRRLGVAELLGGTPERALLGNRLKGREMSQFDAQPSIRSHDGNE